MQVRKRQAHRLLRSAEETISFPMLVQLCAKGHTMTYYVRHRQENVGQTCMNIAWKSFGPALTLRAAKQEVLGLCKWVVVVVHGASGGGSVKRRQEGAKGSACRRNNCQLQGLTSPLKIPLTVPAKQKWLPAECSVLLYAMQCNVIQCNAMQCNAMQCNSMRCNAMQCNAMQWG